MVSRYHESNLIESMRWMKCGHSWVINISHCGSLMLLTESLRKSWPLSRWLVHRNAIRDFQDCQQLSAVKSLYGLSCTLPVVGSMWSPCPRKTGNNSYRTPQPEPPNPLEAAKPQDNMFHPQCSHPICNPEDLFLGIDLSCSFVACDHHFLRKVLFWRNTFLIFGS